MRNETNLVLHLLKENIQYWEEESRYWEDARVAGLQNINGSNRTAQEIGQRCRAQAEKLREYVADLTSPNKPVSGPVGTSRFNE
jgi:hypothetical protein